MDLSKTGKLIATLRREKGFTQKEVADKLNICAKTVSKWETGRGFPDVSLISRLSKFFQVDISKILEGELPEIKPEACNVKKIKIPPSLAKTFAKNAATFLQVWAVPKLYVAEEISHLFVQKSLTNHTC